MADFLSAGSTSKIISQIKKKKKKEISFDPSYSQLIYKALTPIEGQPNLTPNFSHHLVLETRERGKLEEGVLIIIDRCNFHECSSIEDTAKGALHGGPFQA